MDYIFYRNCFDETCLSISAFWFHQSINERKLCEQEHKSTNIKIYIYLKQAQLFLCMANVYERFTHLLNQFWILQSLLNAFDGFSVIFDGLIIYITKRQMLLSFLSFHRFVLTIEFILLNKRNRHIANSTKYINWRFKTGKNMQKNEIQTNIKRSIDTLMVDSGKKTTPNKFT